MREHFPTLPYPPNEPREPRKHPKSKTDHPDTFDLPGGMTVNISRHPATATIDTSHMNNNSNNNKNHPEQY